jgi:hypothetical protein
MQTPYPVTGKEGNPQGNSDYPPPACPSITLGCGCLLLYQDRRPT